MKPYDILCALRQPSTSTFQIHLLRSDQPITIKTTDDWSVSESGSMILVYVDEKSPMRVITAKEIQRIVWVDEES